MRANSRRVALDSSGCRLRRRQPADDPEVAPVWKTATATITSTACNATEVCLIFVSFVRVFDDVLSAPLPSPHHLSLCAASL
ncbi:unnamed protein product [Angiostrongylus costaricensis]|uniref:Uncharacterized protein n=1 Tax=Angiostrongylus costaricensis TaxID=334426 RepID=A0A0R3PP55_ANGCS|nr:unnamed protein product [Angiostrongylus costaricensis]